MSLSEITVIPHNHFDPTWRRCFDRPADYDGWRVRSYAEMEDMVFTRSLDYAPRGFTQSEGQTALWRKYLERHPQAREKIRAQVQAGRFCFTLAGETVQDSNLPTPEALIRNFLIALPLYRDLCGEDHPGLKIAWVEDAFGNSPNYPQILKGVGAETVWRTSYRMCPGEIITGIDGTRLSCMDHIPNSAAWSVIKYRPCIKCQGFGCAACADSGIEMFPILTQPFVEERLEAMVAHLLQPPTSDKKEDITFATGLVFKQDLTSTRMPYLVVGGEETVPEPGVVDAVHAMAEKYKGKVDIRFGTHSDVYQRERERLQELVKSGPPLPPNDLNPAMPGCYVTRIQAKQRIRALAHRLTAVESHLANQAWTARAPIPQPEDLNLAWQHITFCGFHDAITGTLIDSAYTELNDLLNQVEEITNQYLPASQAAPSKTFTILATKTKNAVPASVVAAVYDRRRIPSQPSSQPQNPTPSPTTPSPSDVGAVSDRPPQPSTQIPTPSSPANQTTQPAQLTWGPFQIQYDLRGITNILTNGRDLFDPYEVLGLPGKLRIGELALDADYGDAWGQRIAAYGTPGYLMSRRWLGEYHHTIEIANEGKALRWHGRYTGGHKKVKQLAWTTSVQLSEDGRRLDFTTEVDWDTESKRLRVLFPVASHDPTATYEVPFGYIDRTYDESRLDYTQWTADHQEYPIQNWFHKSVDLPNSTASAASATADQSASASSTASTAATSTATDESTTPPPSPRSQVALGNALVSATPSLSAPSPSAIGAADDAATANDTAGAVIAETASAIPIAEGATASAASTAGVALLVKGTPCVRWTPRMIDLSLLRSPEWEFCVVETAYYEFWDIDGQRDTGQHRFEYSLWPHTTPVLPTQLTPTALAYNRPQFEPPPFQITSDATVTAWKPAQDGQSWILRLQETSGKGTHLRIDFHRPTTITPCDLLERPTFPSTQSPTYQAPLHQHGILTLRVR